MSIATYGPGGVLREFWDDSIRLYTAWNKYGAQTLQRAYTAEENARADIDANRAVILAQALTALTTNTNFLALTTPTNAQVLAQVQALTRQMDGVIRVVGGYLDGTN
jgi:hypothetical protein